MSSADVAPPSRAMGVRDWIAVAALCVTPSVLLIGNITGLREGVADLKARVELLQRDVDNLTRKGDR